MATILAPRLERLFLLAVTVTESALPRALFSMLYISPLMLELRTTFLAAEELASPLNMVSRSRARRPRLCWVGSAAGRSQGTHQGQQCWAVAPAMSPRSHPEQPHGDGRSPEALTKWHRDIQVAQPIGTIFPHAWGQGLVQDAAREGVQDPPVQPGHRVHPQALPQRPGGPGQPLMARRDPPAGRGLGASPTRPAWEQEGTLRLGDSPVHPH